MTDRSLLEGFWAGNRDAMATVYWEYVRKVERLLSEGFVVQSRGTRVGGACDRSGDLADLVQEVFLRAFSEKGRLAYDGLRDYGPYLFAIARHVLVDWARSRGREIHVPWIEMDEAAEIMPVAEHTEPWAAPATVRVVEAYLAALPEDLRKVYRLRHQEDLSQVETAERLGVSRQTLRTLERRLRDGLAAALDAAVEGDVISCQPESTPGRNEGSHVGKHEADSDRR